MSTTSLFCFEPSQRESGTVQFTVRLTVRASMNSDEEQKRNAELEQDAHPKRHRLLVATIAAPFAAVPACADLIDSVAEQSESNHDFYHFAIGGAHPYSVKSIWWQYITRR
jgi:hypothetical protein